MRTTTKDEAGKHAIFNEDFVLNNIDSALLTGIQLKFETYDEDGPGKLDYIGGTKEIPYQDFIDVITEKTHDMELLDKKLKVCGSIIFKTQFYIPEQKVTALVGIDLKSQLLNKVEQSR